MRQIMTDVENMKKPRITHLELKQKHILITFLSFLRETKTPELHYTKNWGLYACEAIYLPGPSIPNLKKPDIFKNSYRVSEMAHWEEVLLPSLLCSGDERRADEKTPAW